MTFPMYPIKYPIKYHNIPLNLFQTTNQKLFRNHFAIPETTSTDRNPSGKPGLVELLDLSHGCVIQQALVHVTTKYDGSGGG